MALSDAQGYYNPVIGETTSYITPTDAKNAIAQMYNDLLNLTGGTMTGNIILAANPTLDLHPTTKKYTDDALAIAMPIGAIIAYGGSAAPTGWHLCNGTVHGSSALQAITGSANTPDLRDRFIIVAGSTYSRNATGGAATHQLTEPEMPSHRHYNSLSRQLQGNDDFNYTSYVSAGDAGAPDTLSWYSEYTGGSVPHNNLPPYYALTYIIKKI